MPTFEVPSFRAESLKERLNKLVKKANKYGNTDISYSVGVPYMNTVKNSDGEKIDVEYVSFTVSGDAPKIAGWELLARIELMGDENLIHVVPSKEHEIDARFRSHGNECEHCKTLRRRNDVYVFANEEKQIAVGRSCLRDFMGIDDPKMIVARAQFFEDMKKTFDDEEEFSFGSHGYFTLKSILTVAAAQIRKNGFRSKAVSLEQGVLSTADATKLQMMDDPKVSVVIEDEDAIWADKTAEFFRAKSFFGNEYMDNVRVIMKQDIVKNDHVAFVVSAVSVVQREFAKEKANKDNAAQSDFVGQIKERIKGLELVLEKIIFLGYGAFGSTYLHLMKDETGNVFSWITGNKMEVDEGSNIKIDASVKEHKVYNGVKQTVLTRAKMN
jgi:ribosomal protein L36